MKNLLETIAIVFVGLLSLSIVFFIVQYNMIEDDSIDDEVSFATPQKKITQKAKESNYLSSLEGYGDDVDVKVDARQEDRTNTVVVKSQVKNDDLLSVVEDKSKSSYMQNLENYTDKEVESVNVEKAVSVPVHTEPIKVKVQENSGEPEKLPEEEIVDEIGMAIDAALDDL